MSAVLVPLRYPAFRFVMGGRVVNMLGNAVAPIALAFAVLDLTGSVRDLGLVVGARSITNVIFILFGGVVADRLPRHLVVVVSCALAALTQGAVAALVLTEHATIPWLIALGAVNGIVSAFAFPATSALVAQTVPEQIRKQANALNRFGVNGATILGASLGGLLVAAVGPGWGLTADAITFAVSAVLFAFVRVATYRNEEAGRSTVFADLRAGWTEFASRTWVWVVVLGFCFFNMAEIGGLSVLGPAVADDTFGRQVWGIVLAAETVGLLAGAFVAIRLRARRLLLVGVVACAGPILFFVALAGAPYLAGATYLAVLLPAAFLMGVGIEQFGIAWEVSIQEHIPADKLARVYSYDALGSFVAIPIGQVAIGPLALAIGVKTTLLVVAGVIALSVIGMLCSRSVRTLEHRPKTDVVPAVPSEPARSAA